MGDCSMKKIHLILSVLYCTKIFAMELPELKQDLKTNGLNPLARLTAVMQEKNFVRYDRPAQTMFGSMPREVRNLIDLLKNQGVNHKAGKALFHGPPGTGKSTLAEVIATETNRPMLRMFSSEFITSFQGSGARSMADAFEKARLLDLPVIIFIDELQGLANTELKGSEGEAMRTIFELHKQLDRRDSKIFVLIATNDYGILPEAIKDRFHDNEIYIGLPDWSQRLEILQGNCRGLNMTVPDFFSRVSS